MGAGLQVFGENGAMKLDITTRLTKILGTKIISGTGEIDLGAYENMQPWYFIQPPMLISQVDNHGKVPTVWIDRAKRKIYWKDMSDINAQITYGVYSYG